MTNDSTGTNVRATAIDFTAHPLVPAVITDSASGAVLMIGFMNEEAYRKTRETGRTHFWSRGRNRLWKKGETSGHEQIVERISVDCELNALLISVQQLGAVCHEGYPSCFYRDIEEDESLSTTMDRWFDPAVVYGGQADQSRIWYEALVFLKREPFDAVSTTSRLLKASDFSFGARVADELTELAGVLEGIHRHSSLADDTLLEGSQALYWLALVAVSQGYSWESLRPDRALDTVTENLTSSTAARLLRGEAQEWSASAAARSADHVHAAMALVAQAVKTVGLQPHALIEHDLRELRAKPYLADYFASQWHSA